jgi:hypothetical protein
MSRALVISCNYTQFNSRLYGCHNDADSFISTIKKIDPKITIIRMRDSLPSNSSLYPTKKNILRELSNLVKAKQNLLFFYYSGHGSQIPDNNNDENSILHSPFGSNIVTLQSDLQDSCLVTNDIKNLNLIRDDDIYNSLSNLRTTQKLYAFSDSCFAGTLLDLYSIYVANYTGNFTNTSIDKLLPEVTSKCNILSSNYSDKLNQIKGNITFISGTRDNAYSYESYINNKSRGHFTTQLIKLLNYGTNTLTLKQFYLTIVGLLNDSSQIPVLSSSLPLNLDDILVNDLRFANKKGKVITNNITLLLMKSKNHTIIKRKLSKKHSY